MEIRKERTATGGGSLAENDLALINRLAKTTLTAEEIYTFGVRLCDNEVDRDWERFHEAALVALGDLFVGKSGIFDHQWSAGGQTARIYRTEICRESGVKTAAGDEACFLKGYAYMLRCEKNRDLIAEIEAGIKKEVSVGCAMAKSVCSICGSAGDSCKHVKGQHYGGKLCYRELQEPTDAYEWSFVAVPAQRQSGVMKHFGGEMELKSFLEQEGQEEFLAQWKSLTKQAELGRNYLQSLRKEVCRLALLSDESLDGELFTKIAERLEEKELLELRRVYERRTGELYSAEPQLKGAYRGKSANEENVFLV